MATNKTQIAESEEITEITAAQQTRLEALRELGQDMIKANKAYAEAKASGNDARAEKLKAMISKLAAQKMQLGEDEQIYDHPSDAEEPWERDTVYPDAIIIKTKRGTEVGEVYPTGNEWGCFHYKVDSGYDCIDSKQDAIACLKDMHQEYLQNKGRSSNVEFSTAEDSNLGESMDEAKVRAISALEDEEVSLDEASDFDKPYGVRWKAFAGREGRMTTKEKFFKTQKQLDAFTDKLVLTDNFYEIDAWCFPPEEQVAEAFKKENPLSQERTDRSRAGVQIKTPNGIGVIVAEYKVPTFSATVPFKRTVRVKFADNTTKEFDYKSCKVLKSPTDDSQVTEADEPNGGRHWGTDTVEMTIPLFIRCLEWAKEDAPDDVALHVFAENAIKIEGVLDVSDYDALLPASNDPENNENVDEAKYDSSKQYGIRYKVFAGKEGRLTTKEKWFKTASQLEAFADKVGELDNFYEIDGYSYPQETVSEEQVDEISDAAAQRLMMRRMQNNWSGTPGAEQKNTRAKVAVANRAARKSGQPGVDMSKQIHIGEATDPQELASRPTWQLEDDIRYLKPMKWQPSAAEEIRALEAELARRAQSGTSVNEDATAGASCSASIATGAVGPLTKTPIKRSIPKKSVKKESVTEEAITELDNGPKGRVKTDNISYDTRRSSAVGVSHAAKDDMSSRKAADAAAAKHARDEEAKNRRLSTRAQERQWALEDAREEPIKLGTNFDFEDMKKIAADYAGAHDIVDVTNQRNYRVRIGDAIVAAVELQVYCEYDLDDFGYDDETKASLGGENVSDAIYLRFARDPKNPKKIVFRGFGA